MKRTPEPELMDVPERGNRLIDSGCGPGDICIRVALLLRHWQITGLDQLDTRRPALYHWPVQGRFNCS